MASLKNKVVALTGEAGGIGSATAILLASRGACLLLADMDIATLESVAQEIRTRHHVDVMTARVDVSSSEQVNKWIEDTVEHFSHLTGAVNLAGDVGKEFGLRLRMRYRMRTSVSLCRST